MDRALCCFIDTAMIIIEPSSTVQAETPAKSTLTRFLNRAQKAVGLTGQVDVLLTSDARIKTLNRNFRRKNKPTDVLSFPAPEEIFDEHAGDLAISLDTAARQAAAFGHTLAAEVRILMLHGLLHLNGMDHEIDSGEMAAREAELRKELRLTATLIERSTAKPPRSRVSKAATAKRSGGAKTRRRP